MLTILRIPVELVLHRHEEEALPVGLEHERSNQQLKDNSELGRKGKMTSQEGLA